MRHLANLQAPLEFALFLIGAAVSWFGNELASASVTAVGSTFLAVAGVFHLYLALAHRSTYWSLCDVLAASLLIAYFGGAAVTLFLAVTEILVFANARGLTFLFETSAYIIAFTLMLHLVGRIEHKLWIPVLERERQTEDWSLWATLAIGGMAMAQTYCLATGIISYQGTGHIANTRNIPYFGNLVIALSLPLPGVIGWVLGRPELFRNRLLWLTALGAVPVEFLFNLCFGRRVILFQTLALLACYVWSRGRGFTVKQTVVLGVLALPIVVAGWYVFLAMRLDRYSDFVGERRDIFSRLGTTAELLETRFDVVQRQQEDNVVTRVFVIGYLSEIMASNRPSPHFLGRDLVAQLVGSVPRIFLGNKQEIIESLKAGETNINRNFGLPEADRAESVMVSAYAEFGWFGVVFYPVIVALIGGVLSLMGRAGHSPLLRIYVLSYTLHLGLTVEASYVTYSANALRTLGIVLIVFLAADMTTRRRRLALRASPRRTG